MKTALRTSRRILASFMLAGILSLTAAPAAQAFVKVDSMHRVYLAIKYGLKHQDYGIIDLLGPNWIEGPEGTLLNVYSPFMLIAQQASQKGFPSDTSNENVKKVRQTMQRLTARLLDTKEIQEIKFSVSVLGSTENFASSVVARIEGFGRGREIKVDPVRKFLDKKTDLVGSGRYEAINTYYFRFEDLEYMEELSLILDTPDGEIRIPMNGKKLY